jgi:hypothetical protein
MTADETLLDRLLGPAAPELTCEQCFDVLDAHVEDERTAGTVVADARHPGMRAHLEGCPACAEEHQSLQAFSSGNPQEAAP